MVWGFVQFLHDSLSWQQYLRAFESVFVLAFVQILALSMRHVHHSQFSLKSIRCKVIQILFVRFNVKVSRKMYTRVSQCKQLIFLEQKKKNKRKKHQHIASDLPKHRTFFKHRLFEQVRFKRLHFVPSYHWNFISCWLPFYACWHSDLYRI